MDQLALTSWPHQLIYWYHLHKRDFPWRNDIDIYKVWICEIMSQQTILSVVLPKFNEFIKVLPTCDALAFCGEETLTKLWSGLGYYARARNLRKGALYITEQLNNHFPTNYEGWLQVPGCGPYTASVISSICFQEPVACVDGNVVRVVSRILGLTEQVWTPAGQRAIQHFVTKHLVQENPGDFNQAIMELGATVCKKSNPQCSLCPITTSCLAHQKHIVAQCPPIKPRKQSVEQKIFIFVFQEKTSDNIFLVQRKSGFLAKTIGFPLFSPRDTETADKLIQTLRQNNALIEIKESTAYFSHSITHHKITGHPIFVSFHGSIQEVEKILHNFIDAQNYFWLPASQINDKISSSLDRKAIKILFSEEKE
ncbi:MAG: hypothetical protein K2X39_02800 [Silvanigrellaceae bacterium]|nr:hypothetical protein [Silvanigrellaceae bacterium]